MNDEESRTAAQLWWQPHPALPALPALPVTAAASGQLPRASTSPVATLCFAVLGLVAPPFGIVAWIWAASQLRASERGELRCDNRGALVLAQVLGAIETVAMVTMVVLLLLV